MELDRRSLDALEIDLATGDSTGGSIWHGRPREVGATGVTSPWRAKARGEAGQAIRTQTAQENGSMEGANIIHGQGTDILRRLGVAEKPLRCRRPRAMLHAPRPFFHLDSSSPATSVPDTLTTLRSALEGRYRVEREIGRGRHGDRLPRARPPATTATWRSRCCCPTWPQRYRPTGSSRRSRSRPQLQHPLDPAALRLGQGR